MMPSQGFTFGDQDIGVTIAGQVDELQVGIVKVDLRPGLKGSERLPIGFVGTFVEAANSTLHLDQIHLTISSQIKELGAVCQPSDRFLCNNLCRTKAGDCVLMPIIIHLMIDTEITLVV